MKNKLPINWSTSPLDAAVETACAAWDGVPFFSGGNSRLGIDCSHFAGRVLDSLSGTTRSTGLRCLPPHLGMLDPDGSEVRSAMRRFLECYPELAQHSDTAVQAGDLLVTGPKTGGPGHIYVVGGEPGRLWSSTVGVGVCYSSFFLDVKEALYRVYRADKSCWLSASANTPDM